MYKIGKKLGEEKVFKKKHVFLRKKTRFWTEKKWKKSENVKWILKD